MRVQVYGLLVTIDYQRRSFKLRSKTEHANSTDNHQIHIGPIIVQAHIRMNTVKSQLHFRVTQAQLAQFV